MISSFILDFSGNCGDPKNTDANTGRSRSIRAQRKPSNLSFKAGERFVGMPGNNFGSFPIYLREKYVRRELTRSVTMSIRKKLLDL
jgi:hypothetical protein